MYKPVPARGSSSIMSMLLSTLMFSSSYSKEKMPGFLEARLLEMSKVIKNANMGSSSHTNMYNDVRIGLNIMLSTFYITM